MPPTRRAGTRRYRASPGAGRPLSGEPASSLRPRPDQHQTAPAAWLRPARASRRGRPCDRARRRWNGRPRGGYAGTGQGCPRANRRRRYREQSLGTARAGTRRQPVKAPALQHVDGATCATAIGRPARVPDAGRCPIAGRVQAEGRRPRGGRCRRGRRVSFGGAGCLIHGRVSLPSLNLAYAPLRRQTQLVADATSCI